MGACPHIIPLAIPAKTRTGWYYCTRRNAVFAVIYRFEIKEGTDDQFRAGWRALTVRLYEECGSLGARLHRLGATTFLAYALWPTEQVWQDGEMVIGSFLQGTNWDEMVELHSEMLFTAHVTDDFLHTAPYQPIA